MAKYGRKLCSNCKVVFIPQHNEDKCNSCIQDSVKQEVLNKHCIGKECVCNNCNKNFFTGHGGFRKYCSESCKLYQKTPGKKKEIPSEQDKIKKLNEMWLNKQEDKRKGKSLTQLIKESEYKRVFDDKGWDHYLKGNRWDNI